jgi:chromosomal replication initiator protein
VSDPELSSSWRQIRAELRRAVPDSTWHQWLEPLTAREDNGALLIEASDETRRWIADRFGRLLQVCSAAVLGPDVQVELVAPLDAGAGATLGTGAPAGASHRSAGSPSGGGGPSGPGGGARTAGRGPSGSTTRGTGPGARAGIAVRDGAAPAAGGSTAVHAAGFNPRQTFEQFVIGDSNRLAHAAALAVAEMPGIAYNPLFICGPPGLGKTHLLHSIGNYVTAYGGGATVRYTTAEAFTNHFVGAIHGGDADAFKAAYRGVDVLLVDDVQFLQAKARTEEEFFHTFNALHQSGAQIVLTSDRLPRDLADMEARLRERFEAGLVTDVRAPDASTRLTILRKRAQQDEIAAPADGALELIADRVTDNVRALEGALIRVVAFGSLTGRPVTAELAEEVLAGLYPARRGAARRRATVEEIQQRTAEDFGITVEDLVSASRAAVVAWPRQLAMYLARELTDQTLPAIGRAFGGRAHTTVLHAHRKTAERIAGDREAYEAVHRLTEALGRP